MFTGNKIEYCVILNVLNFLACCRRSDSGSQHDNNNKIIIIINIYIAPILFSAKHPSSMMSESKTKMRRTGGEGERREHPHLLPHPITVFSCSHLLALSHQSEHLERTIGFLHIFKTHRCTVLRRVSIECIFYTVSEYASSRSTTLEIACGNFCKMCRV